MKKLVIVALATRFGMTVQSAVQLPSPAKGSAGTLVVLLILAGVVIPSASRRLRARGGGTYGRR